MIVLFELILMLVSGLVVYVIYVPRLKQQLSNANSISQRLAEQNMTLLNDINRIHADNKRVKIDYGFDNDD